MSGLEKYDKNITVPKNAIELCVLFISSSLEKIYILSKNQYTHKIMHVYI